MGFSISVFPKQPLVAFAVHEHDQGNGNQNGWKEEEETTCDYGDQNAQCPRQHFHVLSVKTCVFIFASSYLWASTGYRPYTLIVFERVVASCTGQARGPVPTGDGCSPLNGLSPVVPARGETSILCLPSCIFGRARGHRPYTQKSEKAEARREKATPLPHAIAIVRTSTGACPYDVRMAPRCHDILFWIPYQDIPNTAKNPCQTVTSCIFGRAQGHRPYTHRSPLNGLSPVVPCGKIPSSC